MKPLKEFVRLHTPKTMEVVLFVVVIFVFCFNQNMGPCTLLPSAGQTDLGNNLRLRADTFTSTLRALPGQASQRQA